MKSGIYKIENLTNGKLYVGSAVNLKQRWKVHCDDLEAARHTNIHLQNSWNKHGSDAFTFEVLERVVPERLIECEQAWMDKLEVVKTGYNICPTAGSCFGVKLSAEHRAKISAALKKYTASSKVRARMSAVRKGHKHSSETRAKLSALNKNREYSSETRAKIGASNAGRVCSPETRMKMSTVRKGRPIHTPESKAKISAANKGRKRSPETRAKMSAAAKEYYARRIAEG